MTELNDYFAHLIIPYPSSFEKSVSGKEITLYDNKTETYIFINHTLQAGEYTSDAEHGAEENNTDSFIDEFSWKFAGQSFVIGTSTYHRSEDQEFNPMNLGLDKNKSDLKLISRECSNLKIKNSSDSLQKGKLYEARHYIRYKNVDTVISLVTPKANEKKARVLAEDIVRNIKGIKTHDIPTIKSEIEGLELVIPSVFDSENIHIDGFGSGTNLYIPSDKSSELSGTNIAVFDVGNKFNLKSDHLDGNDIFLALHDETRDALDNYSSTSKASSSDTLVPEISSNFLEKGSAFSTDINVWRVSPAGDKFIEHGDNYTLYQLLAKNKKGIRKLIILSFPTGEIEQISKLVGAWG